MTTLPYSGRTTAYVHEYEPWQDRDLSNTPSGVRKEWVLDARWTTCPVEVAKQVKDLWKLYDLGNDHYVLRRSINDLLELVENRTTVTQWHGRDPADPNKDWGWIEGPIKVDYIIQYLREMGVQDHEEVWIRSALVSATASLPDGVSEGIEQAAKYVDKRLSDYIAEHGMYDPETGQTEFPGTGEEYVGELEEIADGIRTLLTARQPLTHPGETK